MPWERIFEWWPIYNKYENVEELKNLYGVMSLPENIEKMINANDNMDKPPIVGLQQVIEEGEGKAALGMLDIEKNKSFRRLIGSMIAEILHDYGYRPHKQKNISHGGSSYFKSATHYEYVEGTATKKLQKEIAIETNRSSDTEKVKKASYIKNKEYIESLEKFRKFWKKYGLSDKIKSIFLSLDIRNENLAQGSSSMADSSVTMAFEAIVFPFAEQLSRYSSSMWLNIYQITSLLENKYPGIVELSGLQITSTRNSRILLCESNFFNMLFETLLEEAREEHSVFESALISKNYIDNFTASINGLNHCNYKERREIPIFRLRNSFDISQDSGLKEHFGCFHNEISEEFFKVHNVMENVLKILKKNTKAEPGEERTYYTLHQVIAELSHKNPIKSHYYPISCIFFELMKRIFRGDAPDIKLMIWPGNSTFQLDYSFEFKDDLVLINGTTNYTPLLSYQPSRGRK